MTFSRKAAVRRIVSPLVLVAVAGLAWQAPAAAQRAGNVEKKRNRTEQAKAAAAPKTSFSKEFIAAYKPIETQANAAGTDFNTLKPLVPGLAAAATTADDRQAAGRMIFNIGQKTRDYAIALQGAEMVLASGKADAESAKTFNYVAAQLAYNLKDYPKSRTYAEAAIQAGYSENDPQLFLADTYFAADQYAEGIKYLDAQIAARKAAGQPIPESWVKRGLAMAYNNELYPQARQWALMYARDYPSQTSWGDAIAITINTSDYPPAEMLDLLRLARRTNTMRTRAQYLEYADAADARKLPNEVVAVLDAGVAAKLIDNNIQVVKDARSVAATRIAADKAELPALQRDAGAAGAKLVTVMAAADTLFSYGKYAEAEALYARAAGMPGANLPLTLTRQGIAQVEQGKYTEAQATFAKVTGARQQIASLWALYAAQKAAPPAAAAPGV